MIEAYDSFICGKRCKARKQVRQARRAAKAATATAHARQLEQQNALQAQLSQQLLNPVSPAAQSVTQGPNIPLVAVGAAGFLLLLVFLKKTFL